MNEFLFELYHFIVEFVESNANFELLMLTKKRRWGLNLSGVLIDFPLRRYAASASASSMLVSV